MIGKALVLLRDLAPVLERIQQTVVGARVQALDDGAEGTVREVTIRGRGEPAELLVAWDTRVATIVTAEDVRWL